MNGCLLQKKMELRCVKICLLTNKVFKMFLAPQTCLYCASMTYQVRLSLSNQVCCLGAPLDDSFLARQKRRYLRFQVMNSLVARNLSTFQGNKAERLRFKKCKTQHFSGDISAKKRSSKWAPNMWFSNQSQKYH